MATEAIGSINQKIGDGFKGIQEGAVEAYNGTVKDLKEIAEDIHRECVPSSPEVIHGHLALAKKLLAGWIHVPYFPAFHRPGWLLRYAVGPHTPELFESLLSDIWAGITVALTLIPQALSYAQLANLPQINGLYTAILPSATYIFFGSSMQLSVGPVALVSLLMGTLVSQYVPKYATDTVSAVDTAAQACLTVGIILSLMAIFNMGDFIHFIAHPVMSGFTTGAAWQIGMNQLKNAFGFINNVPQAGQVNFDYNYEVMQWWQEHFNRRWSFAGFKLSSSQVQQNGRLLRNFYAVQICFGLFVPLIFIYWAKEYITPTPERKKKVWFRVFTFCAAMSPFCAIIIGGHVAWQIKRRDHYNSPTHVHSYWAKNLKIVGAVTPGLSILRNPNMYHPWGAFFSDCIPLALIAFMEGYSVARRIAVQNKELHLLNASQEMWAIGISNLLGSVSSAYPVSGSFSRSSLNQTAGARTPFSKMTCLFVVLLALGTMTKNFYYIPQAALSAVIFVAIAGLVNIKDFWEAWKHSKKDFITLLVTFSTTFIFDTSIGLAAGIGCSLGVYLFEAAFSNYTGPHLLVSCKDNSQGVAVIRIENDFTFLNSARIKQFIINLTITDTLTNEEKDLGTSEYLYRTVSGAFDRALKPHLLSGVDQVPRGIVIDLAPVRLLDITGKQALQETFEDARHRGILISLTNVHEELQARLAHFGIVNDVSTAEVNLDQFVDRESVKLIPTRRTDETTDLIPSPIAIAVDLESNLKTEAVVVDGEK